MPKKNSTSFEKHNEVALKHGGAAAEKALQRGEPFTGLAADMELQVWELLETVGEVEILTRGAVRLETVAQLYYNAFIEAAQAGDIEKRDRYANLYRQFQAAALAAWERVRQAKANGNANVIDAAITSIRGSNGYTHSD